MIMFNSVIVMSEPIYVLAEHILMTVGSILQHLSGKCTQEPDGRDLHL